MGGRGAHSSARPTGSNPLRRVASRWGWQANTHPELPPRRARKVASVAQATALSAYRRPRFRKLHVSLEVPRPRSEPPRPHQSCLHPGCPHPALRLVPQQALRVAVGICTPCVCLPPGQALQGLGQARAATGAPSRENQPAEAGAWRERVPSPAPLHAQPRPSLEHPVAQCAAPWPCLVDAGGGREASRGSALHETRRRAPASPIQKVVHPPWSRRCPRRAHAPRRKAGPGP